MKRRHLPAAAVLLLLAAVAASRGLDLASAALAAPSAGPVGTEGGAMPLLTALGEVRWYRWAQRHPAMTAALLEAADPVPAGARVEWVVPPRVDRRWLEIMAFYHLPAVWTVTVRPRGTPPTAEVRSGEAGVTHRVHLLPDGRAGVRELR